MKIIKQGIARKREFFKAGVIQGPRGNDSTKTKKIHERPKIKEKSFFIQGDAYFEDKQDVREFVDDFKHDIRNPRRAP